MAGRGRKGSQDRNSEGALKKQQASTMTSRKGRDEEELMVAIKAGRTPDNAASPGNAHKTHREPKNWSI